VVFSGRIRRNEPKDAVPEGQKERQPLPEHPEDEVPEGFEFKPPPARYQVDQRVIVPKRFGDVIIRVKSRAYDQPTRRWLYDVVNDSGTPSYAIPEDDILPLPLHDKTPPLFEVDDKVRVRGGGAYLVARVARATREGSAQHRYELDQLDPKYVFDVTVTPDPPTYASYHYSPHWRDRNLISQNDISLYVADERPRLPAAAEAPGRCVKCGRGSERYPAFTPTYRTLESASLRKDHRSLHGREIPDSRNYLTWTCKHCGYGEVATRCADDE
jgi:hypothetical protein